MIPQGAQITESKDDVARTVAPSKTYELDLAGGRIGRLGMDGREAVKQAIHKALSTRRYEYLIYSSDYGMEWSPEGLAGRSMVESELERWIREALMPDDRITEVGDFRFRHEGDQVTVSFTAQTDFGSLTEELEVNVNV